MTEATKAARMRLRRGEALEVLAGLGMVFYWLARSWSVDVAVGVFGAALVGFGLFGRRALGWA